MASSKIEGSRPVRRYGAVMPVSWRGLGIPRNSLPLYWRLLASVVLLAVAAFGAQSLRLSGRTGDGAGQALAGQALAFADDQQLVRQVLVQQGTHLAAGDYTQVMDLWSADAVLVDARSTEYTGDDSVWRGRSAIRSRYAAGSPELRLPRPSIDEARVKVEGGRATLMAADPGAQDTHMRWTLVKREGAWRIAGLTYNLPGPATSD